MLRTLLFTTAVAAGAVSLSLPAVAERDAAAGCPWLHGFTTESGYRHPPLHALPAPPGPHHAAPDRRPASGSPAPGVPALRAPPQAPAIWI